jgi:four helix bundle protein
MASIKSHEDLVAWQLSDELEDRVYEITARSSARKDRDFCNDIQRSGRSAPANLSEAFHRFRPRDMARFARIALGSLGETINHLRHARKQKYITEEECDDWTALASRALKATNGWLTYLNSCRPEGPARTSGSAGRRRGRRNSVSLRDRNDAT